jgi:ADP-ribose pyrophosphatase YjhB (NUDIX family)
MSIPENLTVKSFLPSTDFYLAAGTVTVDPKQRKVLIVHDLEANKYQLPRGRKDWGESLTETAIRETFEETGVRPTLLAVPLSTRATAPEAAFTDPGHRYHAAVNTAAWHGKGPLLVPGTALLSEEPFAMMQHYQAFGQLAVVVFFVGVADSREEAEKNTQMADEKYESLWVEYDDAAEYMEDEAYGQVVRCALELVERLEKDDRARAATADLDFGGN